MNALVLLLTLSQALGAAIGFFYSIQAEIYYVRALKDGKIDNAENAHLLSIGKALRWGMCTVLLSSIGLVLFHFVYLQDPQPVLTAAYWELMVFVLITITASWMLARRHISFALGSAGTFFGWGIVALLAFGQLPQMQFGALIALYLIGSAVIAAMLGYIRTLTKQL